MPDFVSRAGQKLDHALATFAIDVTGKTCADLGSNTGGFVDCLLQRGALKIYAIERGYGVLEWKLRKDPRVVAMERTNAMHVTLPEPVDLVTIDVSWTKQKHILPPAKRLLKPAGGGEVVVLIKPHYEAPKEWLRKGVLPEEKLAEVLAAVERDIRDAGFTTVQTTPSPIRGGEGNAEVLAWLRPLQ